MQTLLDQTILFDLTIHNQQRTLFMDHKGEILKLVHTVTDGTDTLDVFFSDAMYAYGFVCTWADGVKVGPDFTALHGSLFGAIRDGLRNLDEQR